MAATPMPLLQTAGALAGATGAYFSARGAQRNARLRASAARTNAQQSERAAQAELEAGTQREQSSRLGRRMEQDALVTQQSRSGLAIDSPSGVSSVVSSRVFEEVDAARIRLDAVRGAFGQRVQAAQYTGEAGTAEAEASAANPLLAAGLSLLASAPAVSARWGEWRADRRARRDPRPNNVMLPDRTRWSGPR